MNRNYSKIKTFVALFLICVFSTQFFTGCNKDNDMSEAVPEIQYIRMNDPAKADSLLVSASLGDVIVLVGKNLGNVQDIWFNDKKAKLNTSYITDATIVLTIPKSIPTTVSDSITLLTYSGIRAQYPFKVQVPPPFVRAMQCEYLNAGEEAIIYGNYFLDDPVKKLQVFFPGNIEGEVTDIQLTQVKVIVPDGVGTGPISIKSLYGKGTSSFYFRDDRNIILNFDNLTAAGGWRPGVIGNSDPDPISNNYVIFNGEFKGDLSTWNEDAFSFNLWNQSNGRPDVPFYAENLDGAVLKFECIVTEPWKAGALQMIFTPYSTSGTNSYIADDNVPRGLWMPWVEEGTFKTNGWTTVVVPLSDFKYTASGGACANKLTNAMLGGLTFFVYNGGINGEDCTPHICLDNIRIVPM